MSGVARNFLWGGKPSIDSALHYERVRNTYEFMTNRRKIFCNLGFKIDVFAFSQREDLFCRSTFQEPSLCSFWFQTNANTLFVGCFSEELCLHFLFSSCFCFVFLFYLPYLSSIHEKANCIAILWTVSPHSLGSCLFRGLWVTCLPHEGGASRKVPCPRTQQANLPACSPHYPYFAERQAGKL